MGALHFGVEMEVFGRVLSTNIPWDQEFSGNSKSWACVSHLRGSGLIPTKAPRPHKPHSTEDKTSRLLVKVTLNSPEHSEKLTPKSSDISRKVSGSVVAVWGPLSLRSGLLQLALAPEVHSFP